MSYYFLLSYAREDAEDGYLPRFYDELVETIRPKRSRREGQPEAIGFLDREGIGVGDAWPSKLSEALRTSRVFVPIYSPSYFASEFCGKEWAVFERRLTELKPRPPLIMPVLWMPPERLPSPLPGSAANVQYDHRSFGEKYTNEGLWRLFKLGKFRDARRDFIDRFTDRLIDVAERHALAELDDFAASSARRCAAASCSSVETRA